MSAAGGAGCAHRQAFFFFLPFACFGRGASRCLNISSPVMRAVRARPAWRQISIRRQTYGSACVFGANGRVFRRISPAERALAGASRELRAAHAVGPGKARPARARARARAPAGPGRPPKRVYPRLPSAKSRGARARARARAAGGRASAPRRRPPARARDAPASSPVDPRDAVLRRAEVHGTAPAEAGRARARARRARGRSPRAARNRAAREEGFSRLGAVQRACSRRPATQRARAAQPLPPPLTPRRARRGAPRPARRRSG